MPTVSKARSIQTTVGYLGDGIRNGRRLGGHAENRRRLRGGMGVPCGLKLGTLGLESPRSWNLGEVGVDAIGRAGDAPLQATS